jgi:hypothetical protein
VIDFRYHVVSIVAVFLALALGLFIGATTLRGKVAADLETRTKHVSAANRELRSQLSDLNDRIDQEHAFDEAVLPYVVRDRLAGQSVTVVSAPDVDDDVRDEMLATLDHAGATVTGDVRLQPELLDPEQDQFLMTLTDQLSIPGRTPAEGSGTERAVALLADVLGTRPQDAPVGSGAAARVLAAFEDGNLISINGDEPRPGSLAVLLTADPPATENADTSSAQLLSALARDLDKAALGAVVAGPSADTADNGVVAAIRDDKTTRADVSTVDGDELPSGLIATVLALVDQADGRAGAYGLESGGDPLPSPSPS